MHAIVCIRCEMKVSDTVYKKSHGIFLLRLCLSTLRFGRDKPRSTRPRVPLVKLGRTKVVKYTMGFIVTVAGIDLIISAESVSHGTVP